MEKALVTILNPANGFHTCVKIDIIHLDALLDKANKTGKLTSVIRYTDNSERVFK